MNKPRIRYFEKEDVIHLLISAEPESRNDRRGKATRRSRRSRRLSFFSAPPRPPREPVLKDDAERRHASTR